MTSIEVPYSIAAVLPTLTVVDITNDVSRELGRTGRSDGIAYISSGPGHSLVRINERESGFFEDLESLLERLVPLQNGARERLLSMLLGPRTEAVPFTDGRLCLGRYQRVLVFSLDGDGHHDWTLTVLG
jgi:thiamine phosphate synthase YjbQ (UPF0047 family)